MRRQLLRATAMILVLGAGCDEENEQDDGAFENGCAADEVSISIYGADEDAEPEEVCEPMPEACPTDEACGDDACIEALYGLCDAPTLGTSCASFDAEVFVVCSE